MEILDVEYENVDVVGDFVLIEKIEKDDLRQEEGIYIPRLSVNEYENCRIGVGKILKIGDKTAEDNGLKAGDFVMYDYHGAHNPKDNFVITNVENVFMQVTEEEANAFLNGSLQI